MALVNKKGRRTMSHWQRIAYVNKATFPTARNTSIVEPEVGRILMQSRRKNPLRGLVGALCYGDGRFFQCLEGPSDALDGLLADLRKDSRHTDLMILSRADISQPSFSGWSMKYVAASAAVRQLMASLRLREFDPYQFSLEDTERMVALLLKGSEEATPGPSLSTEKTAGNVVPDRWLSAHGARYSLTLSIAALLISMFALVVSLRHH